MTPIDYFAWAVFIIIIVSVVWAFVALAQLPKKIAIKNNHPQVDAVNMASWLGLLLSFGVVWIFAMVWASMHGNQKSDTEISKENKGQNL